MQVYVCTKIAYDTLEIASVANCSEMYNNGQLLMKIMNPNDA